MQCEECLAEIIMKYESGTGQDPIYCPVCGDENIFIEEHDIMDLNDQ